METTDNFNVQKPYDILKNTSSGSYAAVYFILKEGQHYYRKVANTKTGGIDKLRAQLEFLLSYGNELNMPKITEYFYNGEACYFDMITNNSHSGFFSKIQQGDNQENWECLEMVLKTLKNFHDSHPLQFNEENLALYLKDKVFKNIDFIKNFDYKPLQDLLSKDSVVINNHTYPNLNSYIGKNKIFSYEILNNIFKNDKCSIIHGDFTIDNIIYDKSSQIKAYLIDPNVMNLHETSFLDYAKMLQSLHGNYEYYSKVDNFEVGDNYINYDLGDVSSYEALYKRYDQYLSETFSQTEYQSIYTHEIIHWLRLMPYKLNKNKQSAVLYYAQLLILLNDYNQKFIGNNYDEN